MLYVLMAAVLILAAIIGPGLITRLPRAPGWTRQIVRYGAIFLAVICVLSTSIIKIPADQVGIIRKIYGASALPEGHIIATDGQTGYQAQIFAPGTFRVIPFFNILNEVTYMPVVQIPPGFYGRLVSRDGAPLRDGQIMADAWKDDNFAKMLDAQYFLTNGGQRGEQLSVLKQGTYPVNLMLYQVRIGLTVNGQDQTKTNDIVYDETGRHEDQTPLNTSIIKVPAGFVGVVRSSVQATDANCTTIKAKVSTQAAIADSLTADLVPVDCKGVWNTSLAPGDYYLNRDAYDVTLVDTRVQTLEFKGGFTRRQIALTVDSKGDFKQDETKTQVPMADGAADVAINTKVEGWEIPQELRVVLQISPQNAPIIVAAVGGLQQVEKNIMVPSVRSHVRNVYGGVLTVTEPVLGAPQQVIGLDGKPMVDAAGKPVLSDPVPVIDKDGKTVMHTVTRPTLVLDTVTQRPPLESEILARVQEDGQRAGVSVKEVRLGESVIPPELLLARQRQQLADQLRQAFVQEQNAQLQRQQVEAARATADQQASLVTSQIDLQKANLKQQQRLAEGQGEKQYLEQIAAGQKAQTAVLGEDRVFMFNMADKIVSLLTAHPDILANQKWPLIVGGTGGLDTAAALISGFVSNPAGNATPTFMPHSVPPKQ